jgi:thymidylate synthase (FAD)
MKIAKTEVTLLDSCGSDLSVVNAARVSFEKESEYVVVDPAVEVGLHKPMPESHWGDTFYDPEWLDLSSADKKLISYLARHKHTSPFNHCFASFRVKAPIFVARQLVKHKFLPWNEVSRRYVDSEPEFFLPSSWRARADNVKQGSADTNVPFLTDPAQRASATALMVYKMLLEQGVCPEQARMVLPQNTMTEWIWSGTLGAWADMCRLRLDPHSQKETREVAEKISTVMADQFPVSWPALMEIK